MKRIVRRVWPAAVWLGVWQAGSMAFAAIYPHGALLLASPLTALKALCSLAGTADFWAAVLRSTLCIWGGWLAGCLLAVVLAAAAARFAAVEELLAPLVSAVKAVPVVSLIILILVLLDSRTLPWVIAGLMAFPPVYANVLAGIRGADRQLLEMARVFRVPPRRQLWGIWGPAVLPGFRAAVSVSTGLCWKAGAAAEVIGLCAGTIGEGLYTAKVYFQTAELFAWTAVIVALSALTEHLALWAVDALAGKAGMR